LQSILDNYLVKRWFFATTKLFKWLWLGVLKRLNAFQSSCYNTNICFRLKMKINSGDFFEYYFESGILYKGLSKVANEGGRARFVKCSFYRFFFNIKIEFLLLKSKKKLRLFLVKLQKGWTNTNKNLETLQLQKKGLMNWLLTGKIRTV
jgi:type I restriction enzyme S subunit